MSNTNINIITADVIKYTLDCSSEYRYGAVSPYLCVLGVEVIITGGTPDAFIAEFHPARAVGTAGQPGLQWQLRGTGGDVGQLRARRHTSLSSPSQDGRP